MAQRHITTSMPSRDLFVNAMMRGGGYRLLGIGSYSEGWFLWRTDYYWADYEPLPKPPEPLPVLEIEIGPITERSIPRPPEPEKVILDFEIGPITER